MTARTTARALTYGFAADADVRGDDVVSRGVDGMTFTVATPAGTRPVAIPGLGRLAVHNGLAATAAGLAAGLELDEIVAGLARGWSAPNRGVLHQAAGVTIVDDSYNASPASVRAALDLLAGLEGRRIAVLGTMLELGEGHDEGHRAVGAAAADVVDLLVVVGDEATGIAEGAHAAGLPREAIVAVSDRAAGLAALRSRIRSGDVVLVKASRGIALDLLVDDLRAELAAVPATR